MVASNGTTTKSKHGVIVLGKTRFAHDEVAAFDQQHAKVVHLGNAPRAEVIAKVKELAKEGGWDCVTKFGGPAGTVNEELFGPLAGQLKFVGYVGAGFDSIDVDWLTSIGAYFSNAPTGVADPVATTAAMFVLMCTRNAVSADLEIKRGGWRNGFDYALDTRGLVVGILGMGTIGKLTRDKLQAFGMKILYHNRHRLPVEEEKGAEYVSFEDLLTRSQCIVLHSSLNKDNYHKFSDKEFGMMKKGAYIVNVSRGPVIDEEALVRALQSGQIARAGLDVFENEPHPHPWLLTCDRVALYPHQAGATHVGIYGKEMEVVDNLASFTATGKPRDAQNSPVGVAA
ncbi:hypothetical protein CALCODRAFT_490828 [Calocera cornea HHB12733]|uniref:Glyoxylate reductase n=1 Tax=Calocera cornea HHB12733 TaxID=1353952 RepID=A0A165JIY3_9BASI|nr:hypothetical protein CALCODRAFT_490828 [Calocera cornea HHB12733]